MPPDRRYNRQDERRRGGARFDQNDRQINYRADASVAPAGEAGVGPNRPWQPSDNVGANSMGGGLTPQTQWDAMFPTSGADSTLTTAKKAASGIQPVTGWGAMGRGNPLTAAADGSPNAAAATAITPARSWDDASLPMFERMAGFNNRRGLAGQQTLGADQIAARASYGEGTNLGRPTPQRVQPQTTFAPTQEDARAIASRYATPGGEQPPAPIMASQVPPPMRAGSGMGDVKMAEAPQGMGNPQMPERAAPAVTPQTNFAPSKFAPLGSTTPAMQSKQISSVFTPITPQTQFGGQTAGPVLQTPPGFPMPRKTMVTKRGYTSPLKRSNNAVA